ncbi:tyrosine-type recombinase/integrase [Bradyrhizobium sp. AUGA SZCCT0182]|uniref:tyrosine-type recombinase/integrase n=1 Tax=Bradyrhizobium sp. AUGA SZCCT0182 TaxID=2807667 RepID=UPI001BAB6C48|nr:tyrosine-type recombinase/integrase [Bradyrhizobium sp. AUGA SZCCT0182]MBR1237011.1 tyrosine-type recombinase/integrase [Bradyrhizobium sp. AUGA SZCCT0182]
MRRKLPPNVEKNVVKGHVYLSYRVGKGPRIKLPSDPTSDEFKLAYVAAVAGNTAARPTPAKDAPRSIGALVTSYLSGDRFLSLGLGSKAGYRGRMDQIRRDHGHRAVSGLTKERIEEKILRPLHNRPGAKIDTLKKLRILIRHAKDDLKWLAVDPSEGIKRGKSKEIRAWTDAEMKAFENRWAFGTKQRAAYELMLNVGTARIDTHLTTWVQADADDFEYTRQKTGVPVLVEKAQSLCAALRALPRKHVCILTTEWGRPFTVDGFSGWMRDAMTDAGLPLDCRPHGLRKTFGRLLADAGATAHDIMAALGHLTLGEAERYTREADRRHGGRRAIVKLEDHKANRIPQTSSVSLGRLPKSRGESK